MAELPLDDFRAGRWRRSLEQAMALPPPTADISTQGRRRAPRSLRNGWPLSRNYWPLALAATIMLAMKPARIAADQTNMMLRTPSLFTLIQP